MNTNFGFPQGNPGARSVVQFCDANCVSRTLFYELQKRGIGPRTFKAGRRTLISVEAEVEWRAKMEAAQAQIGGRA